jgi:hypothetical protein
MGHDVNKRTIPMQRDRDGRFVKGNRGGPGNPFAKQVALLRREMFAAIKAEEMAAIVAALVQKATEGNVGAVKLVLAYTIGRPAAAEDPDEFDAAATKGFGRLLDGLGKPGEPLSESEALVLVEALRKVRPELNRVLNGVTDQRMQEIVEASSQRRPREPLKEVFDGQEWVEVPTRLLEECKRAAENQPSKIGGRAPSTNGKISG